MILVLTGTIALPFDRLAAAVAGLSVKYPVVFQSALSEEYAHRFREAKNLRFVRHLPAAEMRQLIRTTRVPITHAGPGTIFDCLEQERVPLVFPRSKRFGEHVDDHQERFARHLYGRGLIRLVEHVEALPEAVARYMEDPAAAYLDTAAQQHRRARFLQRLGEEVEMLLR